MNGYTIQDWSRWTGRCGADIKGGYCQRAAVRRGRCGSHQAVR